MPCPRTLHHDEETVLTVGCCCVAKWPLWRHGNSPGGGQSRLTAKCGCGQTPQFTHESVSLQARKFSAFQWRENESVSDGWTSGDMAREWDRGEEGGQSTGLCALDLGLKVHAHTHSLSTVLTPQSSFFPSPLLPFLPLPPPPPPRCPRGCRHSVEGETQPPENTKKSTFTP